MQAKMCYLTGDEAQENSLDLAMQSYIAKMTGGISPAGLILAWTDWLLHFASSPGKRLELAELSYNHAVEWLPLLTQAALGVPTQQEQHDSRFSNPHWNSWPYNGYSKAFLQRQQLCQQAVTGVRGVSQHHENVVNFTLRQILDVFAPSNYPWLNPEVVHASEVSQGRNLQTGWMHWLRDMGVQQNALLAKSRTPELAFQPGREVAVTPGKVVFRNHLIELIQYAPQTANTYVEPVLIVPSWIMKYYILDLSPHNSLVHFLVQHGHSVFMISWKNPQQADSHLGMQDYLDAGLFAALATIARLLPKQAVHAVGYCLGGTLLSIGAAALAEHAARPGQTVAAIKTVSLLAAQTDFSEPGELGLFIDDSQLAMLDALMWEQGYLKGEQMADSFQLLNSRDMVWSRAMRKYLLGARSAPSDLTSWNADTTRLPYRMHSEYLKHLFLHNDLAEGRYCVKGHPIALNDLHMPIFVVGTERDHVSPWHSVYKLHLLTEAPIDFVLASGGHNAGIVSEPGQLHRSYRYLPESQRPANYVAADQWLALSSTTSGSWWPHWHTWLAKHSSPQKIKAPPISGKAALGDAPGHFVFEK
ncbi:MAG: polyhydroxyalkanoic acid synthase [Burkholderiales bacterium]|nr:polyhydroxyalkanoic acid synthase [Burkholderiales bacterium]